MRCKVLGIKTADACSIMDESRNDYAGKGSQTKIEYMLYDSIYIKSQENTS